MKRRVQVIIAGDGPQLAECQELAASLGLTAHIAWLGFIHGKKLAELYRRLDVLVVPSRSEGFGLVAVEGMMHGLPIVAARVGGLPEVIDDGITGLLFAPEDEWDLAKKLETLSADEMLASQLGAAGRKRAAQCFSPNAYRASIERVYAAVAV